jgi:photolyase PhrII
VPASLHHLPAHLAERVVSITKAAPDGGRGEFILYWARTAVRAHENPALDVAVSLGAALGVPVFVYHALSERYPFASDRHHLFILEGARDFAAELGKRGIATAFHLERDGHRGPHLVSLAARAAVVITELMPVAPLVQWTAALSAAVETPVWQVDTSCVVPMPLTTKAYDRAFAYREATAALRSARVATPWTDVPYAGACLVPALPFTPVDLATADLPTLVAQCRIDHAVAPVSDTRGGSTAGYARWHEFVTSGRIDRYDRVRNDPSRSDGVSRMSAYLHYGMVSPFRLAREAHSLPGPGAEKWLDELLIWRELAYTFCFHRPDHGTIAAIPTWARETLREHELDHRELHAWEPLARGRTSSAFWNIMQRSLLAHGELHNSVRMTWGKAFAGWTPNAEVALETSVDLNHRYALDGRDPASYGGLLWCLGQFDRPFSPPNRIHGTVRGRAVSEQATRVNVGRYGGHIARPAFPSLTRVAVIGAGLAGLICARTLADHNVAVTVFEKSRGFGGRCATRRDGAWQFDHGAQYFTVRDPRLLPLIRSWHQQGVIGVWPGVLAVRDHGRWSPAKTGVRRWVGVPGMNALGIHLATDLDVQLDTLVSIVEREGAQWRLLSDSGNDLGVFDVVLACVPGPQACALLTPLAPRLAVRTTAATMHATMATMVVLAERPDLPFDGAFINDHPILRWIGRNNSKPGRPADEAWVLHATRAWSTEHLESDPDMIAGAMTAAFQAVVGASVAPVRQRAHRWRFALPEPVASDEALYDGALGLGAAGDWCGGPRMEGALLSGIALAGRVLTHAHGTTA